MSSPQAKTEQKSSGAAAQLQQHLTSLLGFGPRETPEGLLWERRKDEPGLRSVALRHEPGERLELEASLAAVPKKAGYTLYELWDLAADLIKQSDLTAIPIQSAELDDGSRSMRVRMTIADAPLDLPRLQRLTGSLESLDRCAREIQAALPAAAGALPVQVPPELQGLVEACTARVLGDSDEGNTTALILRRLQGGVAVAMAGSPARTLLALSRLVRACPSFVELRERTPIAKLPQIVQRIKEANLLLAAHASLLHPRMSLYEMGQEVHAMMQQLASRGLPVLIHGTRGELEGLFGVGQGLERSALEPTIQDLAPARDEDLVRACLSASAPNLPAAKVDKLVQAVLKTLKAEGQGRCELLAPLSNLAALRGPDDPELCRALSSLAKDLAGCRETFGGTTEAPAEPRPQWVQDLLVETLRGERLGRMLLSELHGQDRAVEELVRAIWREALTRDRSQPLRLMVAGPTGTGKSQSAKILASCLQWPYHYIDAGSFDSEHAVMTSLAGSAPGIVNSFQDGKLTQIARSPAVVEMADLDHARDSVRAALTDFMLRILQEGTLQTGSGQIVRTVPWLIFIYTTNVAFGGRNVNARFGFKAKSRHEVREAVISQVVSSLGHAFYSRVGAPILFDEFTSETALTIIRKEIEAVVKRVTGARKVVQADEVAEAIAESLATIEEDARRIIDQTDGELAEALRCYEPRGETVLAVRHKRGRIVIEPAGKNEGKANKPD